MYIFLCVHVDQVRERVREKGMSVPIYYHVDKALDISQSVATDCPGHIGQHRN
jgi:hypothetical protein